MDGLALAAALAVMGAIVTGMIAFHQGTLNPRGQVERRLGAVLSNNAFEAATYDLAALRPPRAGRVPFLGSLLEGKSWTEEVALRLERADVRLTVSEFVSLRFLMALGGGVLPFILLGGGAFAFIGSAGGVFAGFMLPSFYLSFAQGRRTRKLGEQLVEGLSLVSSSLKAGFGLMQSLELASREVQHPLSTELRRTLHDINIGSSTEAALQGFSRRSGSEDVDIVITAMLVQQSTGGNLSEILDNVAHTMRERIRIRGEIKTLTMQQVLTGFIIGGLPIVMMGLFSVISADYMDPLFNKTAGNVMLIGAGMLELFGVLLIKKILAIEV